MRIVKRMNNIYVDVKPWLPNHPFNFIPPMQHDEAPGRYLQENLSGREKGAGKVLCRWVVLVETSVHLVINVEAIKVFLAKLGPLGTFKLLPKSNKEIPARRILCRPLEVNGDQNYENEKKEGKDS